jgi:hypothetical protein
VEERREKIKIKGIVHQLRTYFKGGEGVYYFGTD